MVVYCNSSGLVCCYVSQDRRKRKRHGSPGISTKLIVTSYLSTYGIEGVNLLNKTTVLCNRNAQAPVRTLKCSLDQQRGSDTEHKTGSFIEGRNVPECVKTIVAETTTSLLSKILSVLQLRIFVLAFNHVRWRDASRGLPSALSSYLMSLWNSTDAKWFHVSVVL